MPVSLVITGILVVVSVVVLFKDHTKGIETSDPITDFFIIKKGKMSGPTGKRHLDRINTRFLMVTLLKLFKKDQLAIHDEKFVYGTMDGDLTKDEIAVLTFLLDHEIRTLDDFTELMSEESHGGKKKDLLYKAYKEAVVSMAKEKHYVNQSINQAKYILRAGGILYGVVAIALIAKGQGQLVTLATYAVQSAFLFILANMTYANSKGAHQRIKALKKERKLLQSTKVDMITSFIYNYIFKRENRVIKKVQRQYEKRHMNEKRYRRFAESYNGFNYLLNYIKREEAKQKGR
jgi:hypothetical protein